MSATTTTTHSTTTHASTTHTGTTASRPHQARERADLLQALATHRGFLRRTLEGLTDEQAGARPTVSELCVGGIVKHVATAESGWARFMAGGAGAMAPEGSDWTQDAWMGQFHMAPGDTVASVLARYDELAAATDEQLRTLPDLDADHELPPAPWFEPGARWSVRRTVLHILAETAQHAGHADILRESIDGRKSMG